MVKQLVDESKNSKDNEWGSTPSRTPFTHEILNEKCLEKFTMPTIPSSDGTKDQKPHLYKYSWYVDGATTSKAVRCRCFPIFQEGISSMWFIRFPSRFISTFDQLATRILDQFRLHTAQPKDVMSLSELFQECKESLKYFMNRFNIALTEVSNPNKVMVFMALVRAIYPKTEFGKWIKMKQHTKRKDFNRKASQ